MVKATGGGRGMKAITAHLRYSSKNGRLEIEDDRGHTMRGKDALHESWPITGATAAARSKTPAIVMPAHTITAPDYKGKHIAATAGRASDASSN